MSDGQGRTAVLVADDQALIRAGFAAIIGSTDDLVVVAEAADGRQALELTRAYRADEYVLSALRAGAAGFLGKDVGPAGLLDAIRTVAGGESLLSPRATRSLIARYLATPMAASATVTDAALDGLTDREREVVALVGRGMSNDQIAEELVVSPLTAKTHVNRAMAKLGARDRAQLVVVAFQTGLVRAGDPGPASG